MWYNIIRKLCESYEKPRKFKKMKKYFSKKVLIIIAVVAVILVVIIIKINGGNGKQITNVIRADIVQEVAATGKVKPNQSVNLGFDKSGRVGAVYASVGDVVKRGQIFASLELDEISADLIKAKASLLEENIKLREIKNTAPISYNDAYKNLDTAIKEGFIYADNAIRNKTDQFFKNVPDNPQFEISITSGNFVHYFNVPIEVAIDINNNRRKVEDILIGWKKTTTIDQAITNLNAISVFLDKMAGAVNTFTSADYAYDTTVNNYKTAISGARSDVSGAISAIVAAKDKLNTAPTLGQSGEFESVLTQGAIVSQAEATVSSLEATLAKSIIRAPFDGVITLQDAKVAGAVSAGATLVSMMNQNEMYIEANISEIHISKIAVGNPVSVTLDAFPDEIFSGEISYIEPGDVIIDGIVNYKIRTALNNSDARIKSGLTANLKIQTAKKGSVLTVPFYAVLKEGDQNFVNKIVGKKAQKIPVSLGLSGNNGLVEILGGLGEGDMVEF